MRGLSGSLNKRLPRYKAPGRLSHTPPGDTYLLLLVLSLLQLVLDLEVYDVFLKLKFCGV